MVDAFPNIDEFGRGSCTCNGTMTGCAVCSTANILVRYGRTIPRLSDKTPDMRALGRRMGARHRAVNSLNRHGRSLDGICCCGTNWCAYCAYLDLDAQGLPAVWRSAPTWAQIEAELRARHPVVLPGRYGRVPVVSEGSYTSTKPARGRSDTGFTLAHMVVAWQLDSAGNVVISDSDFGSPSRPVVPPHSIWTRSVTRSYWEDNGRWGVTVVARTPPSTAPTVTVWWGSEVASTIRSAYTATAVASKLRSLGITNYGKAINYADLEAGLEKRRIDYGTSVQLIDVRALMKTGTGPL